MIRSVFPYLFSILTLTLFLNCDCPPIDKSRSGIKKQIEASQVIVKVIGVSRSFNKYKFKVLTSYKGDFVEGQIVEGEAADNCEMFINPGTTYVLFGYMTEVFHTNGCDLSFDIEKPFPLFPPPPPLPPDSPEIHDQQVKTPKKWEVKYDKKLAKQIVKELNKYKKRHSSN